MLEGLEEFSEEEQLMLLLEISKQEVEPQPGLETRVDHLNDDDEDEEYKKSIEVSKKEEEDTLLAIIQSLSLASRIPECPVCFERFTGESQVFQCQQGHFVCGTCRPRVQSCPVCRGPMMGRCNGFERFLQSLDN